MYAKNQLIYLIKCQELTLVSDQKNKAETVKKYICLISSVNKKGVTFQQHIHTLIMCMSIVHIMSKTGQQQSEKLQLKTDNDRNRVMEPKLLNVFKICRHFVCSIVDTLSYMKLKRYAVCPEWSGQYLFQHLLRKSLYNVKFIVLSQHDSVSTSREQIK